MLQATLGQPLREVSHSVSVQLEQGLASYRVRRSFANSGTRHEEAYLRLNLPYGAAATALRIRSGRRWFAGELLERERAAALYQKLTGIGPHTPRDPALLEWVWPSELALQVFPVPPGGTGTVEYTLTVPTRYAQGRYLLSYPLPGSAKNLSPAVLQVSPASSRATVRVDGQLAAADQPLVLGAEREAGWLAQQQLEDQASYVVSELEVDWDTPVKEATVELDLRHSYRSDLKVQLVSPAGSWHLLADRAGGQANDLRRSFRVELARPQPARGSWRLVVSDHAAMDVGSLERWSLRLTAARSKGKAEQLSWASRDTPLFIPDAPEGDGAGHATIEISPPPIRTLTARLGRVVAGPGREFARLEIDAAPQLRPLPDKPAVVFVLDGSHSLGPQGIKAQLQLVRSFLSHVPDTRVELVVYRRRAERLLGQFLTTGEVLARLGTLPAQPQLAPGNGSALEQGVAQAVALLRTQQQAGARYLLLLGDALLRSRWQNQLALRELARSAPATVSHLVVLDPREQRELGEQRDDEHPLAPLAATRGGVLLQLHGLPSPRGKELDQISLGLVRPTRIDSFQVVGLDPAKLPDLPERLEEGQGIREQVLLSRAPRQLTLRGKIWAAPFRRTVAVSEAFSRASAAFVFGLDLHEELNRQQLLQVAFYGRCVSPVTSYLAIEPGVRPSRAGIERGGGRGGGGFGSGSLGRSSRAARPPGDIAALLRPGVQACVAQHRPGDGWSATLELETTYDEVVDVIPATGPGTSAALLRCLEEAAWALRLTRAFNLERQSYQLQLP